MEQLFLTAATMVRQPIQLTQLMVPRLLTDMDIRTIIMGTTGNHC